LSKPRVVMDPAQTYRHLVPVDRLAEPVTPSDDVYVIAHMGIARVDVAQWRLSVDGLVERPFELDYDALTSLPATEVTAVLECFGNPVEPDVATRRVGNVVWRGVRLAELVRRAGPTPAARGRSAAGRGAPGRYARSTSAPTAARRGSRHAWPHAAAITSGRPSRTCGTRPRRAAMPCTHARRTSTAGGSRRRGATAFIRSTSPSSERSASPSRSGRAAGGRDGQRAGAA